jgi:hypothetical protein
MFTRRINKVLLTSYYTTRETFGFRRGAVKICPKCQGNMLKGYLGPYFGKMRWYERKSLSVWHGIQAWRCPKCNYLDFYIED